MKRHAALMAGLILAFTVFLTACAPKAVEGPVGPAGPAGPQGPAGPPGDDASVRLEYVGSQKCGQCHEGAYATFVLSGHANGLTAVSGAAPDLPYDRVTGGVGTPPDGYAWSDISYVIGGFSWAAAFVDQDGYVVTGDAAKWNYANEQADLTAAWGAYHSGEENLAFDCAQCHTTGYQAEGHQGDLEGVVGTWAEEGIQCEACHGPGSLHASDPYGSLMKVDRSNQLCGECHSSGELAHVSTQDGFAVTGEQFDELYNSKHFALQCIACHDPHASSQHADAQVNPDLGLRQTCDTCHWQQTYSNSERHFTLECTQCHMAPAGLSGQGDPEKHIGDLSSHIFSINPDPNAPQFAEDGTLMPYLTLATACTQCHNGEFASVKPPEEMSARADGYHTAPPPVIPTPETITETTTTP